jgi:hypothetical protein
LELLPQPFQETLDSQLTTLLLLVVVEVVLYLLEANKVQEAEALADFVQL